MNHSTNKKAPAPIGIAKQMKEYKNSHIKPLEEAVRCSLEWKDLEYFVPLGEERRK